MDSFSSIDNLSTRLTSDQSEVPNNFTPATDIPVNEQSDGQGGNGGNGQCGCVIA